MIKSVCCDFIKMKGDEKNKSKNHRKRTSSDCFSSSVNNKKSMFEDENKENSTGNIQNINIIKRNENIKINKTKNNKKKVKKEEIESNFNEYEREQFLNHKNNEREQFLNNHNEYEIEQFTNLKNNSEKQTFIYNNNEYEKEQFLIHKNNSEKQTFINNHNELDLDLENIQQLVLNNKNILEDINGINTMESSGNTMERVNHHQLVSNKGNGMEKENEQQTMLNNGNIMLSSENTIEMENKLEREDKQQTLSSSTEFKEENQHKFVANLLDAVDTESGYETIPNNKIIDNEASEYRTTTMEGTFGDGMDETDYQTIKNEEEGNNYHSETMANEQQENEENINTTSKDGINTEEDIDSNYKNDKKDTGLMKTHKIIDTTSETILRYENESSRIKRQRIKLTNEQKRMLEYFFHHDTHPRTSVKYKIARKINLPLKTVKIWFQNRRAKVKADEEMNVQKKHSTEPYYETELEGNQSAYLSPNNETIDMSSKYPLNTMNEYLFNDYDSDFQEEYDNYDFNKNNFNKN